MQWLNVQIERQAPLPGLQNTINVSKRGKELLSSMISKLITNEDGGGPSLELQNSAEGIFGFYSLAKQLAHTSSSTETSPVKGFGVEHVREFLPPVDVGKLLSRPWFSRL